jgi:hypothetical protein
LLVAKILSVDEMDLAAIPSAYNGVAALQRIPRSLA